jgi:hypothetical protein
MCSIDRSFALLLIIYVYPDMKIIARHGVISQEQEVERKGVPDRTCPHRNEGLVTKGAREHADVIGVVHSV